MEDQIYFKDLNQCMIKYLMIIALYFFLTTFLGLGSIADFIHVIFGFMLISFLLLFFDLDEDGSERILDQKQI